MSLVRGYILLGLIFAAILGAVVVLWLLPSYFEARSFNKLTGGHATTWDALWVELRVMDGEGP